MTKPFVFISYRRDDSAGHAGRLEEALERACGEGTVFRDVRDIELGQRFADVLRDALSQARVVIVLIGPRWAGTTADGQRRIDHGDDVVRLEVVTALNADCKVIPVLLNGTPIPRAEELPEPMRGLFRRQALFLRDENWSADVERLVESVRGRSTWRGKKVGMASAAAVVMLVVGAAALWLHRPATEMPARQPASAPAERLLGDWHGQVVYGWGDKADERFRFERFAGEITGTASFLGYPRTIEEMRIADDHLSFVTHSTQSMGEEERQVTHRYTAEWNNGELRMRLHSTGGFDTYPPYDFAVRRVEPGPAAESP